jgi:hypothetical protein
LEGEAGRPLRAQEAYRVGTGKRLEQLALQRLGFRVVDDQDLGSPEPFSLGEVLSRGALDRGAVGERPFDDPEEALVEGGGHDGRAELGERELGRDDERDAGVVERMGQVVDGEYQKYTVESGAYIRQHFFGVHPTLLALVEDLTDAKLRKLRRGGHDPEKVFAAYTAMI